MNKLKTKLKNIGAQTQSTKSNTQLSTKLSTKY
jgi:hypothetical protein